MFYPARNKQKAIERFALSGSIFGMAEKDFHDSRFLIAGFSETRRMRAQSLLLARERERRERPLTNCTRVGMKPVASEAGLFVSPARDAAVAVAAVSRQIGALVALQSG